MHEMRKKSQQWLSLLSFGILIGVILLTLFPPAVGDDRAPVTCMNNLKRLALAFAMYADRYDQRMPMDSASPTLVGSMKLLSNVVTSANFLHCPNDARPGGKAEANFSKLTALNISYSYVPNLIWQDRPDSIVALDRIGSTLAGSTWPKSGNHEGRGGNVAFIDGHVQWCTNLTSGLKDKDGQAIVLSP